MHFITRTCRTKILLCLASAGLFASMVSSVPAAPADAATSTLSWHACDKSFQCATLRVPISYKNLRAGTIRIAVARMVATGSHPTGDLLLNPGGPGASGIDFLEESGPSFPAAIRSAFNLVSFDPRGVERSDPITCVGAAGMRRLLNVDPAPVTASQIKTVVAATKAFVAGCVSRNPAALLANAGTIDEAADMDLLRSALGDQQISYLGLSYGTYLGALYAQAYPKNVRAMVLDGAVDPSLSSSVVASEQADAFETDLHDFFSWCGTNSKCKKELPHGAAAAYKSLMARLANGSTIPADLISALGGRQSVALGEAQIGALATLYSKDSWPDLAQAISEALGGDASLLAAFALQYSGFSINGQLENIESANTAINCIDRPSPIKISSYQQLAKQLAIGAPDFGASEAWSTLPCAYWPDPPVAPPAPIHAPGSPPILVIGTTHDPATPYEWAQALASQLAQGVLLTRTGDGHTGYFSSNCIQKLADKYLLTLGTPPPGTICSSS